MLLGRLADLGMSLRDQASLSALTEDVVKTSEIEGETLNVDSVRSSIARRLGVDIGALSPVDRHVEGVVEMVIDVTAKLNPRQVKVLNNLHDGFEGKLTSSKWASIANCSRDSALRDINQLLKLDVLRKPDAGGRSTTYELR